MFSCAFSSFQGLRFSAISKGPVFLNIIRISLGQWAAKLGYIYKLKDSKCTKFSVTPGPVALFWLNTMVS